MATTDLRTFAGAAINNAILDPFQGFDADIWMIDQATGNQLLVGRFTSIQITIRNATEPYMEFNQRMPRYLDGEIQIGWVIERGMLDARILQQTFGMSQMTREMRMNRSPRFQITFEVNAPELDNAAANGGAKFPFNPAGSKFSAGAGGDTTLGSSLGNGELAFNNRAVGGQSPQESFNQRKGKGQIVLTFAKLDSFTMGAQAGRSVIANRWEGLAEGIYYNDHASTWAGTSFGVVETAYSAVPKQLTTFDQITNAGGYPLTAYQSLRKAA